MQCNRGLSRIGTLPTVSTLGGVYTALAGPATFEPLAGLGVGGAAVDHAPGRGLVVLGRVGRELDPLARRLSSSMNTRSAFIASPAKRGTSLPSASQGREAQVSP